MPGGFLRMLFERGDEALALLGGEDAGAFERPRKGLRAAHIGIQQLFVKVQGAREALEDFRRSAFEPAAPQFHFSHGDLRLFRGGSGLRTHLDRQPDQVDEAQRVLLVVLGAHGEAGDVERIKRIRRLAADRLDIAFVQPQRDLASGGSR
jgi:hypothetical protein